MAQGKGEQQQALLGLRLMTAVQRQGLPVYELTQRAQLPVSTGQKMCAGAGKQPRFWTLEIAADDLGLGDAAHGTPFPPQCPWTVEQILDEAFWPEGESL